MRYILLAVFLLAAPIGSAHAQSIEPQAEDKVQNVEKLKKTAANLEEALKKHPDDVQLYVYLGMTYTRLENADEARQAFEAAVKLDPKKAIAHFMLGLIYEKKGLKENAVAAWKACLENAVEPRMRETAKKHLHHLEIQ